MDLKQLEYFVRVAELGSFTRAAQVLGIAQPALSRQVRLLEVELRQNLLVRNGRGATPSLNPAVGATRQTSSSASAWALQPRSQVLEQSPREGSADLARRARRSAAASRSSNLPRWHRRAMPST